MPVLGIYVRVQDQRFVAGFAILDAHTITSVSSLAAPSSDDARSLGELYRHAHDLIGSYRPEKAAHLSYQNQNNKTLGIARRAEGAILAAAGHRDCPVTTWGTVEALRWPLGLEGKAKSSETIAEITAMIEGADGAEADISYAAAAALATIGR